MADPAGRLPETYGVIVAGGRQDHWVYVPVTGTHLDQISVGYVHQIYKQDIFLELQTILWCPDLLADGAPTSTFSTKH